MADLDIEEIKKKKFNISVENLITIGMVVVTVTGMWYSIQGELEEGTLNLRRGAGLFDLVGRVNGKSESSSGSDHRFSST